MPPDYVHGYSDREQGRLLDQAATLAELLHAGTRYPPGSAVLEAGCGVGAQTVVLARSSPGARLTCVDRSAASLAQARARAEAAGAVASFLQADLLDLPFPAGSFDHVFVCFVLEHLPDPARALAALRRQLCPGGTLTAIEGDHGSAVFHPEGAAARRAVRCLVTLQARAGGDACIGRRLRPLLEEAGFAQVEVSPRTVYADAGRPAWVEGFTRRTFTAMVEGVGPQALAAGLTTPEDWAEGLAQLDRTAGPEGVFCYTFFKGVAVR